MQDSQDELTPLEKHLNISCEGDKDAARLFFEEFLASSVVVPERYQSQPLSDSPRYPNDFFNLLGIQAGESKAVIPVFAREVLIEEWCGQHLQAQTMTGAELLERVPEEWWLTLNPGSEYGKDFSPWELEQLRGGTEQIPALIDELFPAYIAEQLEVKPLDSTEHEALIEALKEVASSLPELYALYALDQSGQTSDGEELSLLLVGAEFTDSTTTSEAQVARDQIESTAQKALIGANPVRLYTGTTSNRELTLGIFLKTEPLFTRQKPQGFLGKLMKSLIG
ncbi:MAG: SseB family protein [Bdellovibrionales bacterium]|nr:SseB family protein [Bdellovibrionales bacterium]